MTIMIESMRRAAAFLSFLPWSIIKLLFILFFKKPEKKNKYDLKSYLPPNFHSISASSISSKSEYNKMFLTKGKKDK